MAKKISNITLGQALDAAWEFYKEVGWVFMTGYFVSHALWVILHG